MKKLTILFAVLLATGNIIAQTWTWDREPEAGQNVNIQIDDVPTEEGPLHIVVYYFDGTELVSNDVGMLPSDNASQIKIHQQGFSAHAVTCGKPLCSTPSSNRPALLFPTRTLFPSDLPISSRCS